jgi:hypothetical protein
VILSEKVAIRFFTKNFTQRHKGEREKGRGKREKGRGKREEGRGEREKGRGCRFDCEQSLFVIFSSFVSLCESFGKNA